MRKITLFILIVIGIWSCEKPQKQPNVIVILSDDQGWGDFSIHGNSNLSTPHIDNISMDGVSFKNFYVCAVCSPTRAEFLTGRYHERSGIYSTSAGGERLDLDETSIGDVFKKAGYATAAYGKWHNGMQYPYHPNGRGFDDFYGFCSGHWGNYFSPMLEKNGEIVRGEGFIVDDFTNHALDFIEKNKEIPFFLYLPYNTPHGPMQVPDSYWNKFKDKELELHGGGKGKMEESIDFTRAALAMCENIDWNVGRIVKRLEELGLDENTIVVYFNDNGPNNYRWNGGMRGRKGSTDEGGVRSPLFIKWPKVIKAGTSVDRIAGTIDLLPTLADLCGIDLKTNNTLDGTSLKPLIEDENASWKDRYIFNSWGNGLSVRSQKYRLDANGRLYDIENDRSQRNDVSDQYPNIKSKMMKAAEDYKSDVCAELPEEDKRPFPLGHPDTKYTQIPARDGLAHGNIIRSHFYPNCSFFTNWRELDDKITWEVDVVEPGLFDVILYYTCPVGDEGSNFELSAGESKLQGKIKEPYDPPLKGKEKDRTVRTLT